MQPRHDPTHDIGPIKACRCPCSTCLGARLVVWGLTEPETTVEERLAGLARLEAEYDALHA